MISLNAIVKRLETFAEQHFFIQKFSYGSPDELDIDKLGRYPTLHAVYNGADYDDGTKTYNFELYLIDLPDNKEESVTQRREIASDAEQCLEDLLADIAAGGNVFYMAEDYAVTSSSVSPIYKANSNVIAGAMLDVAIQVPYSRSACNLPIDGVQPEGGEFAYARRGLLRILTINGVVDVLSVNTLRVPNGTLTDNGNGDVTLSVSGAGGGVSSVNEIEPDINGNIALDSDDIPEGAANLYYTDARVDARAAALGLATQTYVDTAVGIEEGERIVADDDLQSQINVVRADVSNNGADILANTAAITAEASARAAADTALQGVINANTTAIANEETARIAADSSLQAQISSNDADITALDGRLSTAEGEIDALQAATYVNSLNGITGAATISAGANVSLSVVGNDIEISASGGGGGGSDSFNTIAVPGQTNIVADHGNDTLNIHAGTGVELTTDAASDTLTIGIDATTTDIPEGTNLYFTDARVSASPAVVANTAKNSYPAADAAKLAGIEAGAEVNPTASEIKTEYESNANTNAYTDAEKSKLAGIAAGAEVNVNADWNATSGDAQILNKPALAAVATSGAYGDLTGTPTIPAQFFATKITSATSYTLDATDAGKYLRFTASSAVTITIPFNVFQTDREIVIEQAGTGQLEVTPASGVTLNNSSANTRRTAERYAVIALKCVASNVFTLTGERELV